MAQLLKKISAKTVYGGKAEIQKLVLSDQKKNHPLYRVFGQATGFVSGSSRFSDKDEPQSWNALAGDFEAINFENGEVFDAAICFLPNYVVTPIVEKLKSEGVESVEFAFDVFAQFDEKAATSYIYLAQAVRAEGVESPVDRMRQALPATGVARLENKGKAK